MHASETTLQKILAGTRVFELPFFQRRYRWDVKNWEELWEDLVEQYDTLLPGRAAEDAGQGHFLGSVVLHPAPGPISTVARYLLVDGQQRITSFMALIAALRDVRAERERHWNPATYNDQYLTNPYDEDNKQRLIPTAKDQEAYRLTIHEGEPTGQVGRAYRFFRREILRLATREGGLDFKRLENALLLRMLVVEIRTTPSDDVNHIFHTLNASGEALAPLDLVRNHTFMQLPSTQASRSHDLWQQLENSLGEERLERYLWAQFVRTDPKATQRNLYPAYQGRLKTLAKTSGDTIANVVPRELSRLCAEAPLYDAIEAPARSGDFLPSPIKGALLDLDAWGSQVHLPLTLEVLSRWGAATVSEDAVVHALRHIESYLVRRALCGIPTNNLNRIFSSLPVLISAAGDVDEQVAALLSAEHRYWPTDRQVIERSLDAPVRLGSNGHQVKYILTRLEVAMSNNDVQALPSGLTVRHVLPPGLTPTWREYLARYDTAGLDEALTKAHTLGNLALVPSGPDAAGASFASQREYLQSSGVVVNESIWRSDAWVTRAIESRSQELAQYAVAVWRRPVSGDPSRLDEVAVTVEQVLASLPEADWTTVDALAEVLALRVDTAIAIVNDVDVVLAVKVLDHDGRLPGWLDNDRRHALMTQLESSGYDAGGVIYESPEPLDGLQLSNLVKRIPIGEG